MRLKLKKRRLEKGFTQKQLATKVGIHRATYSNIELGNKNPSFSVATKIKKELSTKEDDIFLIHNVPKRNKSNQKVS
ncbi:helix-turn-helix transcriptional regulator [Halonatronum saccharophilum]|uniref:helix-turn-helix transcriptional regulator n=1 Tax=Halonatronum saccharophilum TaxID=150060 RepID=UPI00047F126E|nr:helix-turn-helix transcriptional regulator [Halonatronum saccharophilum]